MTKFRLKYIKKEYEKGNLIPFIKATKKEISEWELSACDKELMFWWASKALEFYRLRYLLHPSSTENLSVTKYVLKNLPWCAMTAVRYRLPDDFLREVCADSKAYDWLWERLDWYDTGTYMRVVCSDNEIIKEALNHKISKPD